jgi:Beta-lactamase
MMNAFSAEINRVIEDACRHYLVPGLAIAVVRGGDAVHVEAYGLRNAASSAAADIDTAFAIGSCSKAFTCALAAALVDRGPASEKYGFDLSRPDLLQRARFIPPICGSAINSHTAMSAMRPLPKLWPSCPAEPSIGLWTMTSCRFYK